MMLRLHSYLHMKLGPMGKKTNACKLKCFQLTAVDSLPNSAHLPFPRPPAGRLELREDTIESLLSASCLLQLSSVVQACCSFLMKQLHPSNCLGIRSYADAQGCHDLQRAAHAYTMVRPRDLQPHRMEAIKKTNKKRTFDPLLSLF